MIVDWADAFIETDDFSLEDAEGTKPVYRSTVGYLVAKNQHGYVLATDLYRNPEDGVAGKLFIPHGMVVSVREVK